MSGSLEDFSVRARRGELDEAEERQLRLLLASSLEARLAHRAGCEFDAEDSVLPGDDALAARLTQRVMDQQRRTRPGRLRVGWKLTAAAALSVAAAAAGPALVERVQATFHRAEVETAPAKPVVPSPRPAAVRGNRAAAEAPAPSATLEPSADEPVEPARARPTPAPRVAAAAAETHASGAGDAAALFAEASRARRQGRPGEAIRLYQQLQRRHPAAAEARAADLALGVLYSRGAPGTALTHFRRYQRRGGPLAPEALWGQAQALSALGRSDEARKIYRTLLTRYPRSAYAKAARAKLGTEP